MKESGTGNHLKWNKPDRTIEENSNICRNIDLCGDVQY